jgi:hypothetical protein
VSKADEWRKKSREAAVEEAADLELPSGMVIRARRPGPTLLASYGHLPMTLASAARGPVPIAELQQRQNVNTDFLTFMRDLLVYCVVEPAISLTPTPDQIHPRDVADDDAMYVIEWAMRGSEAASLATFRAKRRHGSAGGDGSGVEHTPERADGDRRSSTGAESGHGRVRSAEPSEG